MTHGQEDLPASAIKILFDERLASQEAHFIALERRLTETRDSILALVAANEKGIIGAMAAADRAVVKAETAAERRFEAVNEFRQALADQTSSFVTRAEHLAEFRSVNEKLTALSRAIGDLGTRVTSQEGRGVGYQQSWAVFVALAGLAAVILTEFVLRRP